MKKPSTVLVFVVVRTIGIGNLFKCPEKRKEEKLSDQEQDNFTIDNSGIVLNDYNFGKN